jgi:hypothetical protein
MDWIAEQRDAGVGWDKIAQNLESLTGILISREAPRLWWKAAKRDAA